MKFSTTFAAALIATAALMIDHSVYANDNGIAGRRLRSETLFDLHTGAVRAFDSQTTTTQPIVHIASPRQASETSETATVNSVISDAPPASEQSPRTELGTAMLPIAKAREPVNALATSETGEPKHLPAMSIVLICLGTIGAVLLTYSIALLVAQYRERFRENIGIRSPTTPHQPEAARTASDKRNAKSSVSLDIKGDTTMTMSRLTSTERLAPPTPIHQQDGSFVLYASMQTPATNVRGSESRLVCL